MRRVVAISEDDEGSVKRGGEDNNGIGDLSWPPILTTAESIAIVQPGRLVTFVSDWSDKDEEGDTVAVDARPIWFNASA